VITVKFNGLDKALKDLETFRNKAVPAAMRDALNEAAFQARRVWGDEIRGKLTVRNQFTARVALQVRKATGGNVKAMESAVGSIAAYMDLQEAGGTTRGRKGHLAIPGPSAAGQAAGSKRTRVVRASNYLGALNVAKFTPKGKRRQRNAIALAVARKQGQKVALLERPKGGKAIFALMGGKRYLRTRLLYDFSKRSAHVKPHATLGPTMQVMRQRMPAIMLAAVEKQLKRHRVLGY
jgi:hypothetical protein